MISCTLDCIGWMRWIALVGGVAIPKTAQKQTHSAGYLQTLGSMYHQSSVSVTLCLQSPRKFCSSHSTPVASTLAKAAHCACSCHARLLGCSCSRGMPPKFHARGLKPSAVALLDFWIAGLLDHVGSVPECISHFHTYTYPLELSMDTTLRSALLSSLMAAAWQKILPKSGIEKFNFTFLSSSPEMQRVFLCSFCPDSLFVFHCTMA